MLCSSIVISIAKITHKITPYLTASKLNWMHCNRHVKANYVSMLLSIRRQSERHKCELRWQEHFTSTVITHPMRERLQNHTERRQKAMGHSHERQHEKLSNIRDSWCNCTLWCSSMVLFFNFHVRNWVPRVFSPFCALHFTCKKNTFTTEDFSNTGQSGCINLSN